MKTITQETITRKNVEDWTLAEIRAVLNEDGLDHLAPRATEILNAARTGCLVWSDRRVRTTDSSRIDDRGM